MRAELRAAVVSEFTVRTGKLASSFKERVVMQNGDPAGVSFELPRYGYILHHGVKAGTVVKRKTGQYTTKGIRKSGFITDVLDRHVDDIGDAVVKHYGNEVEKRIRF
jgi:hypothetical protein